MFKQRQPVDSLEPFRERIDAVDDALVDLLAERFDICAEVAAYKRAHGIAMAQPARMEAVKSRCADRARARGLDAGFARDLYDRIIDEACALETRIIRS